MTGARIPGNRPGRRAIVMLFLQVFAAQLFSFPFASHVLTLLWTFWGQVSGAQPLLNMVSPLLRVPFSLAVCGRDAVHGAFPLLLRRCLFRDHRLVALLVGNRASPLYIRVCRQLCVAVRNVGTHFAGRPLAGSLWSCVQCSHLSCAAYRLHLSHCLLSLLAELEDTGPFEELRYAYNSVRGKNELEAPPHGEWTMVGFCGHIFCRWGAGCLFLTHPR